MMDLQLSDKVAVVTGASQGIGLAITRALAAEGVRVVAGARRFADGSVPFGDAARVHPQAVDLGTPDGPAALVAEAVATFGGLDILVNNVGATRPRPGGFLSVSDDDWTTAMTINFLAAVRTTRAALPHLLERGAGTIVTVCSVNAFLPDPLVIDYGAAKAALLNFSKALSKRRCPRRLARAASASTPSVPGQWRRPYGWATKASRGPSATRLVPTPTRSPGRLPRAW
jgi:NAD(P)-dependent dehydrogenase (short-subunit alcohol dehydrogenase family)